MLTAVLLAGNLSGAPLDVTIKGQARDKIQIQRVVPKPDVPLKDVIPFSRLGQTDWILTEELDYVGADKQVALMDVKSPRAFRPSMIEFPKPPFFVQSYPPPPTPIIVDRSPDAPPPPGENESWTFIVVDQHNNLLKKIEGNTVPTDPITWDGMRRENFVLKVDEVYSSMLVIQESPDATRTIVGDPISLPALRYVKGTDIIFEFSNRRVYEDGLPMFSPVLKVLVDQLINELQKYDGSPFHITIHDKNLELAQRRAKAWKELLEDTLLRPKDQFSVRVALPQERGDITQVLVGITR
jgi:hypothetical protein